MRVLMIAPEPMFRPRGTPFSVRARIRALLRLGHEVDLVTYPFGEPLDIPGLRVHRSVRPPFVRDVAIGPSIPKLLLDVPLFLKAWRLARTRDYDLLHTHEEACLVGGWIASRCGIPHLYDMHSSLPEQLTNFPHYNRAPLIRLFDVLERRVLERSDAVIAICPALGERARVQGYGGALSVIENTYDAVPEQPRDPEGVRRLARELDVEGSPVVVYTGSLEPYQGLDLLVEAAARVRGRAPDVRYVVVGGSEGQVETLRKEVRAAGVEPLFRLRSAVPQEEVFRYQQLATVLVTPRSSGTNTPLKIYQYLRTGKPILATDIPAHTQVLDDSYAELVPPRAEALAEGLLRLLENPERRRRLGDAAEAVARRRYGVETYMRRLEELLERVRPQVPAREAAS